MGSTLDQYTNNFEKVMQNRFGKSAETVLNDLAAQDMTYNEAAKAVDWKRFPIEALNLQLNFCLLHNQTLMLLPLIGIILY